MLADLDFVLAAELDRFFDDEPCASSANVQCPSSRLEFVAAQSDAFGRRAAGAGAPGAMHRPRGYRDFGTRTPTRHGPLPYRASGRSTKSGATSHPGGGL